MGIPEARHSPAPSSPRSDIGLADFDLRSGRHASPGAFLIPPQISLNVFAPRRDQGKSAVGSHRRPASLWSALSKPLGLSYAPHFSSNAEVSHDENRVVICRHRWNSVSVLA